jgi:hypothetical protein
MYTLQGRKVFRLYEMLKDRHVGDFICCFCLIAAKRYCH